MGNKHTLQRLIGALALIIVLAIVCATPALAQGENGKFVVGEDYVLEADQTLDGGLVLFGGSATIKKGARVNGDLFVSGGDVTIAGEVYGDVAAWGGNVRLNRTAVIVGNVLTLGGEVLRDEGSQVSGSVSSNASRVNVPQAAGFWRTVFPGSYSGVSGFWQALSWIFESFFSALAMGALAVLVIVIFERQARQMQDTLVRVPWASLGMGALTFVAALAVALVLTITLCLIPAALLLLLALGLAVLAGWAVVSLWLGELILKALKVQNTAPVLAVAAGAVALAILSRVPCIGWLVTIVAGSAGLGTVVLTQAGTIAYPRPLVPSWPPEAPSAPAAEPPAPAATTMEPPAESAPATPAEGQPDEPAA
jgi:cytoskeletal protein CcmA (bactofilin family)